SSNAWLIKLFAFFAFSILLILIVLMTRARLGGNRAAGYFLLAVVALTMAGLHDFLHSLHIFRTRLILPYAFSFVLAAMAFVLSRRYARALKLSEELLQSMESLVHTRTSELQEANSKLQKAAHEKDTFFRIVAHELRTPLTFLMGPLQNAMRTGQSISNHDAGDLLQGARRILRLLNQLLDIQRITAGKTRLEPRLISLRAFMLNISAYFTPYARGAQVEFITHIPDYLPAALFDPEKLDRCILNLLSNALKFTPAGGSITFNVSTIRDADTETEYLRVAVTDSGMGVPEEHRRELFQSFSFSNKSLRNWSDGSGLGLSIVREYIELHKGFVRFEPADRRGSRFYFQIPILRGDDSTHGDTYTGNRERTAIELAEFAEEPGETHSDTAVDRAHVASILVVDDEQLIHKYLGRILVQAGYTVISALTIEDALTRLKTQTPRLIISDFVLPDQTGIEFIQHIHNVYTHNHIPIIMITADAHREVAEQAMSAGAYAVLIKPFSDVELLNLVHRAIHVRT
ncbi:MAG: response regulator, partial [Leptospiraceae bacterium]|nr:response regulator [Leptospiraceae bacterium]